MTDIAPNARYQVGAPLARRRLVKRLDATAQSAAIALADILDACNPAKPCNSAACPMCGGRFQLAALDLADRLIKAPAKRDLRGRRYALSLVSATGLVAPDALTVDVFYRVKAEAAAALVAADIPPGLFAVDVSFNEDVTDETPPHWCVHVQGVGINWLNDYQTEMLKRRLVTSPYIACPVDSQILDRNVRGVLYPFKPRRVRRESFVVPASDRRGAYRDSKSRELRAHQSMRLALAEHEFGYRGRLLNHQLDAVAVDAVLDGFEWSRDGP